MSTVYSRLTDPNGACSSPKQLRDLQEKISDAMTRLFKKPENGGNPYLFSLAAPKPHFIRSELPHAELMGGSAAKFTTAATDGKAFYWHPDFLQKLTLDEVPTIMAHEGLHVTFFHPNRMNGKGNHHIVNIAMDFVVNTVLELEHERSGRARRFTLWGGNLGEPCTLQEVLDWIDGRTLTMKPSPMVFVDKAVKGRGPESIYDEIMKHWDKSPRKCKACNALSMDPKTGKPIKTPPFGPDDCQICGSPPSPFSGMDSHMKLKISRQEALADAMRASNQAKNMRGTAPAEVEEQLKELSEPVLRPEDAIRAAFQNKQRDVGNRNDYKRYRRRGLAGTPPMYYPKKFEYRARWVAMIDTSGSMSDADLSFGISQLQVFGDTTDGTLVPVDAVPYWDKMTRITSKSDLKRTKIVGRGGTVFDEFFAELPRRFGRNLDLVVIITDGDCGTIPMKLRPNCDVLWLITRSHNGNFQPSFGRTVELRRDKA